MFDYTVVIRNGPPGYCDTDVERIHIENEDDLTAAVKEVLRGYDHIRSVKVFCDQDPTKQNLCEMRRTKVSESASMEQSTTQATYTPNKEQ